MKFLFQHSTNRTFEASTGIDIDAGVRQKSKCLQGLFAFDESSLTCKCSDPRNVLSFEELLQRVDDFCTVQIKAMVKVDEFQVLLQGSLACRSRKVADSFRMIFQRGNACRANAVAEEVEGRDTKLALVRVDD